MSFELTSAQIKELEKLHRSIKDKRIADRVKCVVALAKGFSFNEIHDILLIEERSARRYFAKYKKMGADGLLIMNYKGGISKLSKDQEIKLCKHIEDNLYSTASEITSYIKKAFNIDYTSDGLVITLHRLGFSYKKTKRIPARADAEKQKAFLKEYNKLRKAQKSYEKTYFIDGVHPTHNVMPAYAWIKKGKEKEVKSNCGRQRININGAYSPDDNDIIVRKDESINAQSTIELFKMIEKKNNHKSRINVISDNARYYKSKLVKEYLKSSKIVMIYLPSYSPNLNLIERLWKFFKKKVMYNKYYDTLEEKNEVIPDNEQNEDVPTNKECNQTWARLIQKVYEADPMTCPKCKSEMRIITIIFDTDEIKKILTCLKKNKAPRMLGRAVS